MPNRQSRHHTRANGDDVQIDVWQFYKFALRFCYRPHPQINCLVSSLISTLLLFVVKFIADGFFSVKRFPIINTTIYTLLNTLPKQEWLQKTVTIADSKVFGSELQNFFNKSSNRLVRFNQNKEIFKLFYEYWPIILGDPFDERTEWVNVLAKVDIVHTKTDTLQNLTCRYSIKIHTLSSRRSSPGAQSISISKWFPPPEKQWQFPST